MIKMNKKRLIFIISIFIFSLILRFYRIDQVPGEWYGDISIVHEYVSRVLEGKWPLYFEGGVGPFYHYVISPIIYLTGASFLGYKIASVIISLAGIFSLYLLGKELFSLRVALIACLFMAVYFSDLVWSRIGVSSVILPLMTSLVLYAAVKFVRYRSYKALFLGAFISGAGLLTYPATFLFPVLYIILIAIGLFNERKLKKHWRVLTFIPFTFIPAVIVFTYIVSLQPGHFKEGYIGSKLFGVNKFSGFEMIERTTRNFFRTLTMYHIEGDGTFRYNVPKSPHLDRISGVFLLAGLFWFFKKRRKLWPYIFLPLIILPLPSIYPALPAIEVPNISRTYVITPLIILLFAYGFWNSFKFLHLKYRHKLFIPLFAVIFAMSANLNIAKYFLAYPAGLPDKNLAPGKIIANYIDKLPVNISLYFSSCCWGEWGEPEPKGIAYQLHNQKRFIDFSKHIKDCSEIRKHPAAVVTDPRKGDLAEQFMKCSAGSKLLDVISGKGILVGKLVFVN